MWDPVNLDELFARTIDLYSDENLEVPLKNPVPNPADDQVASAPAQYGFIMTQSDQPNNNEVPVTSPSLPAPEKRRNKKLHRGSKNWRSDEVKKRNLMWNFEEKSERNLKSWHQFTSAAAYYDTWKIICDILHGYTFSKSLHDFYNAWQSSSCIRFRFFTSSLLQSFDPVSYTHLTLPTKA